ncbi:MAG: hypothetical protein BWY78_00249 [Alphaproteobacteria bacterium ADurb.Bin438]|nr:MAG: hypothetical protein BWY78_00249 [Alphaproteobacteria bacterium ADurb.Bin438]
MHKLEITLKQHTPIIHFQHDQDGATLRASEVKPKLDRFIYNKWLQEENGNKEKVFKKHGHLTVGYNEAKFEKEIKAFDKLTQAKKTSFLESFKWALNYKMTFKPNNNKTTTIGKYHENAPMYFGNMGDENEKKHFIEAEFVNGKILTQCQQLETFIKNNISEFFFIHNFGTRQSKGYGSFTVEKINNKADNFNFKADYCFRIKTNKWQEALFKTGLFYQSLRSGINIGSPTYSSVEGGNRIALIHQEMNTKFYMKPIVFLYAKDLGQQWDKKTIKQTYFNKLYYYRKASGRELRDYGYGARFGLIETSGLPNQQENIQNSDVLSFISQKQTGQNYYFDYRDLFGLSSDEKWYSYGVNIKKENKDVDRYKSPITFKPVKINGEFNIFILLSDIDDDYQGKVFTIKSVEHRGDRSTLQLQIPTNKSFLYDLFDFIANKIDINHCVDKRYRNYVKDNINYYDVLSDIYSQLKSKSQCNTQP